MKRSLITLALLISGLLIAEPMSTRETILPGANETAEWYQPSSFDAAPALSGTLTLWVRPDKWDAEDTGIYSLAEAGSRKEDGAPGLELYRQNDGSLRALLFRDMKTRLGHLTEKAPAFPAGQWSLLALTWKCDGKSTIFTYWLNGKKLNSHWVNFVWGDVAQSRKWRINDSPAWAKARSKHRVAIGKTTLHDRVLSADELARLAQEKAPSAQGEPLPAKTTDIILNDNILPGAPNETLSWKPLKLTPDSSCANEGTLAFWLYAEDWSATDKSIVSIAHAGNRNNKVAPGFEFDRNANGNLRLLWFNHFGKSELGDIIVQNVRPGADHWLHLALTWLTAPNGTCTVRLYINGKEAGNRWNRFKWLKEEFPPVWHLNNIPAWAKATSRIAIGKLVMKAKAMTASEIEMLAKERLLTGERAYIDRAFLPETDNVLAGQLAVATPGTAMHIEYIDEMGKAQKATIPLNPEADGTFKLNVKPFADTLETAFTVKDAQGGFPAWRIRGIERDPGMPKVEPNYWQSYWIDPMLVPGAERRKGGTWYFVKEFDLDLSQVAKAACQYIGSNNGTAYVNGVDLGRTYGWATPKAVDDVLPLLRNGKNVLGGDAYIPHDHSTFMAELTLVMKDGSVRYIATDKTWRFSSDLKPGWGKPEYDHSKWPLVHVRLRPPMLPYGETKYKNYVPVPKLAPKPVTFSAKAGNAVHITLSTPLEKPVPGAKVWFRLIRSKREFYRMPMEVDCSNGQLTLRCKLTLPPSAQSAEYDIALESRSFDFPETSGTLKITGEASNLPPLTAEVKKVNGTPVLHFNGKPVPALLQRSAINVRNNTTCYRFTTGMDQQGVRMVELNLGFGRLWQEDGSINTEELDLYIQSALFYAPHSYLVVFFNTNAPRWYLKKFPGERYVSNQGPISEVSYASQQYRRDSTVFLTRLIEYLKTRPYYSQICGFGLDGGDDGQYMQWAGRGILYVGDYSKPMLDYFHDCLKKKYGTIAALNAAWKTSHPDFSAIPIPSMERRRGDEAHAFLDPLKDLDIIEFNRAFSSCVVDEISDYAAAIKKATNRTRIVSAYYGKIFTIAGILQWGEFDMERVLRNPDFDYLIAVDYKQRPAGCPHELVVPPSTYRMHNKIFVDEADIRTYIAGSDWGKAKTLYDFTSMARKMFIKSWTNGHGLHWYDLHGGMFENPALQRTIGNIQKIAEVNPARSVPPAEIALIADEKSYIYTTYFRRSLSNLRQSSAFGHLGAPYDVWFISDLGQPGFPEYKMYVFLNLWAPTPEQRQAVEALKRDGKLLVFLHNSGYIDGQTRSVENVSRLTGIKMEDSGPIDLVMRFSPGNGGPLFKRVKQTLYCSSGKAISAAVPADPAAPAFGAFMKDTKHKPMAYRKFANWKSFYCAMGVLPLDLWRELAREAGVHFYIDNDPDAMIYLGGDLLGIHTGKGGTKTLHFPEAHTFIDAVTGEVAGKNTKTPTISLKPGETRIFRIK